MLRGHASGFPFGTMLIVATVMGALIWDLDGLVYGISLGFLAMVLLKMRGIK